MQETIICQASGSFLGYIYCACCEICYATELQRLSMYDAQTLPPAEPWSPETHGNLLSRLASSLHPSK